MELNKKSLAEKSQNKYIQSFPILIILFVLNIASYQILSPLFIYGFFIIGILEYHFAKLRTNYIATGFLLNFLVTAFLLIPGFVSLIFNNFSIGFPLGILGLIILLGTRIYLMVVTKKKIYESYFPKIFSIETLILILLNIYIINFYNYQNKIIWETEVSSGITSTLKISKEEVVFLTNDDFIMRNFYNFPQTYSLDKDTGRIKKIKSGYKFSEEFEPFMAKTEKIVIKDIEIKVIDNRLYIRNIKTGKLLIKFIAKGKIVTTPKVIDGIVYFAVNAKVPFDKVKRTKIYALDFQKLLK